MRGVRQVTEGDDDNALHATKLVENLQEHELRAQSEENDQQLRTRGKVHDQVAARKRKKAADLEAKMSDPLKQ